MLISLAPKVLDVNWPKDTRDGLRRRSKIFPERGKGERGKGKRRTLRDHLNIDIMLPQHTEHGPRNPHHILHLLPDQTHNRHLIHQLHRAQTRQLVHRAPQVRIDDASALAVVGVVVSADEFPMAVEGHGYVDFGAGDQVDGEAPFVEDGEGAFEETARGGAFVGAEVDD